MEEQNLDLHVGLHFFVIVAPWGWHLGAETCKSWYLSYQGCSESIQPFWISRDPVAWSWYNLAASERIPYCASVNSHSPMRLVSRQWDAVDWASVPCDHFIQNDRASRSGSSRQCTCPFYSSRAGFLCKASHHPGLSAPLQPRFGSVRLLAFPKAKIAVEGRRFVNATVTQYTTSVNGVSLPTD